MIARFLGCENRTSCNKDVYKDASSDLHDLWPALAKFNHSRGKQAFGELPGEQNRFPDIACDFERNSGRDAVVEPRDNAKGEIARSILYMIHTYNLPEHGMLPMLVRWHIEDKVSDEERRRNKLIEELQGNKNPFIE